MAPNYISGKTEQKNGQPTVSYVCEGAAGPRPCWQKCVSHLQAAIARVLGTRSALSTAGPVWVLTQLEAEPRLPHGSLAEPAPMAGCVWEGRGPSSKDSGTCGQREKQQGTGCPQGWSHQQHQDRAKQRSPRTKATEANHVCSHCQGKGPVGRTQASAPTTFSQERTPENYVGRDSTQEVIHINVWSDFLPYSDTHSHTLRQTSIFYGHLYWDHFSASTGILKNKFFLNNISVNI